MIEWLGEVDPCDACKGTGLLSLIEQISYWKNLHSEAHEYAMHQLDKRCQAEDRVRELEAKVKEWGVLDLAVGTLPDGYEIQRRIEKGAAAVSVLTPDGDEDVIELNQDDPPELCLPRTVSDAMNLAVELAAHAAAKKEGGK